METAEFIEFIVRDMRPAGLLVIDALRASNQNRMCRFLQLSLVTYADATTVTGLKQKPIQVNADTKQVPGLSCGVLVK
ncbi:hypothetical protein CQS04_01270 [Chryseomicrobium excrementi]|uniref:Uncharacterized protein n=2 Tax=Chryseomicrobium excrementi TaxID=2041346 RepID=A0A2M9F240_9BACL|nr:hypothetical protein CQS04_01270 [Chryseomicrobium excrementi]